ncbi:8e17f09d-5b6b-471f-bb6a-98d7531062d5 [Sclerotinia trifoliorum]|uniref:8e17f09d-5b6b-471f-bb6a-98d7531062d5 n=1 Tax=Sclerotinia trifoliorum TaxID=28548 RepID=A0A8H2VUL0_9HELO|nr:8e17f09d-5b6b-471f-bb6a-98d7531062d5 [Sclerotinia trifoliorum]
MWYICTTTASKKQFSQKQIPVTLFNMLSYVIVVLLGLAIFDGVGCLPILKSIESVNLNIDTIRPRDDAPLDRSSVLVKSVIGTVGLIVKDGRDDLPVGKKAHKINGRGNPSPPATLDDDDEDTIIEKKYTPSLIGKVIIEARDRTSASPHVTHSEKRESASHSRAKNMVSPATLDGQGS